MEDIRGRTEGSDKLAITFVVLSRANAAKVKRPLRFCLEELVERADCRCLGRFKVSFEIVPKGAAVPGRGEGGLATGGEVRGANDGD